MAHQPSPIHRDGLARASPRSLGRHLRDTYLGGRQDPLAHAPWSTGGSVRNPSGIDLACSLTVPGGFRIDFDFIDHRLKITDQQWQRPRRILLRLAHETVADFYTEVMGRLRGLGLSISIWTTPVEIEGAIPFDRDVDARVLRSRLRPPVLARSAAGGSDFTQFRAQFLGKASPVHFFWGSFDLAVTRFSGRVRASALTSAPPESWARGSCVKPSSRTR